MPKRNFNETPDENKDYMSDNGSSDSQEESYMESDKEEIKNIPFSFNLNSDMMDEELVYSREAYDLYYNLCLDWSCSTCDFINIDSYVYEKEYQNLKIALICGTQAPPDKSHKNILYFLQCENIKRNYAKDEDSESEDDIEDEKEELPSCNSQKIYSNASFNKLQVDKKLNRFVACMQSDSRVRVYDMQDYKNKSNSLKSDSKNTKESLIFSHQFKDQGFALDWHPDNMCFVTGSRSSDVNLFDIAPGGWKHIKEFKSHNKMVEAVCFKKDNDHIFASAGADNYMLVWDKRTDHYASKIENLHEGDTNAIAFKLLEDYDQIVTGGDDGKFVVTDLRFPELPIAKYNYHKKPIFCLEWSPHDSSTLLCSSFDNRVTVWDLALEAEHTEKKFDEIPAQLIFEHYGNQELGSTKFHKNIPYLFVSSGEKSVNIWRPENLYEFSKNDWI